MDGSRRLLGVPVDRVHNLPQAGGVERRGLNLRAVQCALLDRGVDLGPAHRGGNYGLTVNEDVDIDAFKAAAEKAYTDLNMVDLRDRIQSEMASVA